MYNRITIKYKDGSENSWALESVVICPDELDDNVESIMISPVPVFCERSPIMNEKANNVNYTPCEKCMHQDVCKMKKEFERFVTRVDVVDKTLTDNNLTRFPDFHAHVKCVQYIESSRRGYRD